MILAKFAIMTGRIFIKVILPLRLEWEPFYFVEGWSPRVGDRVAVDFAGKEYTAVVSDADAGREAEQTGIAAKAKKAGRTADGLEPVSLEEIALWRKISDYYLCTVGEVYKAAYPAGKVSEEAVEARREERRKEREAKAAARLEEKVEKLLGRIAKKEEQAAKAKKAGTKERYLAEKEALEKELEMLRSSAARKPGEAAEGWPGVAAGKEITLSAAQETAYSEIKKIFAAGKPALLHGVTGSGKTEIYLKLAQETLGSGRNVLYLVPEIALSRQLEDRLEEVFPRQLMVFHSGETMASRRATASEARKSGAGYIILGTRSAIFLPHKDLGLVVIDEEQDPSYKQDSPAPRYNGRESAIMLASIFKADVVLGSATPSLESLYNCGAGRYGLVRLDKRYYEAADSDIEVIDTIAERRKNGMVGNFSRKLIEHIRRCLDAGSQVMILREKRAFASAVQCQECGDIPKCSRCDATLSLHHRADGSPKLVCHYCGRVYEYSGICSRCSGAMRPLGAGTQKIEEEAAALFPQARIARLDSDSAQSRGYETDVIRRFSEGGIDILIGTRMVAKGFDFSGLSLVAVLQADSILSQQDYKADERGLQLLEQFRGRCGRRGTKGLFVIQTSQPEHPVYQSIEGRVNFDGTTARLLAERKLFGYPPYSRVVGVIIKDYNLSRIELLSQALAQELSKVLAGGSAAGIPAAPGITAATGVTAQGCGFAPTAAARVSVIGPYSPAVDKISNQNIRLIRVLLPKDRSLKSNKAELAAAVAKFEKDRKYTGHIALDVDPA
jgi:primosomal protein N' (replication factor Y) (superfamily II helicase)